MKMQKNILWCGNYEKRFDREYRQVTYHRTSCMMYAMQRCRSKIMDENAIIDLRGKNWYVSVDGCVITVNAGSYTIITAHREK